MSVTNNITATVVDPKTGHTQQVKLAVQINPATPPLPKGMLFGACTNGAAGIPNAEKVLGHLDANRIFFSGGLPANYSALGLPQGVVGFVSFKADGANTVPFVKSCPAGTRIIYHHEPENDYGGNGAQFVNEFKAIYTKIKNANPNVLVGNVAMTFQYDPYNNASQQHGSDGSFLVPADHVDFYGADNYENKPGGGGLAKDPAFQGWYKLVKDRGKPLSLCEYGVGVNPVGYTTDQWTTVRPTVFAADKKYLANVGGFDSVLYWYFTGAQGDWRFYDSGSAKAWQALAAN